MNSLKVLFSFCDADANEDVDCLLLRCPKSSPNVPPIGGGGGGGGCWGSGGGIPVGREKSVVRAVMVFEPL